MHNASVYGMGDTVEDESRQQSKKRRGSNFRCPYYAANPETCQEAKCKSWHNPYIAAVTRHALRDSNKNDATGMQSKAIKSLSHRKLSAEDRWKRYYEIHGGVDAHEHSQPYWPQSSRLIKRVFGLGSKYAMPTSYRCQKPPSMRRRSSAPTAPLARFEELQSS